MTGAEESLLLVERNGRKKSIKGSNLNLLTQDDILLINRDGKVQKIRFSSSSTYNAIQDTDLFACWKDDVNYHMTGVTFKDLLGKGPEIEYFRHTLDSPYTLCPGSSERYSLQWKVLGDTTCVIKSPNGSVFSYAKSGNIGVSVTELGTFEYTMEATGSNGVVEIRKISFTTRCLNPTNTLSGPSSSTYGTSYTLNYTQSNHSRGDLAGSSVYDSSGSKTFTRYPTKEITYCSTLESYNCCGSVRSTHCVKVPGFSVAPVSLSGVPSQPKKKEQFTVTPSYGNSSKLKNVEYKWELESGIDSGFANFNGNAAGRPGQFTSDERTPLIYVINNTHSKNGNAVSQPPGKLPDGVKLKLTVKNKDNNEESSTYVYFKTYPM
jgi:hypothetical protein